MLPDMASIPRILPRRADRSPITLPMNSSGVSISTAMIGACRLRLQLQHHMTVLAMAAGLLDEFPLGFGAGAADGFAIRNLRLADVGFDAELASHPLHQDFQMQLAHAGNDGLARFLIGVD